MPFAGTPSAPTAPGPDCSTKIAGSIIGCEDQTLGEEIPVIGTGMSLRYQSERSRGFIPKVEFNIGPTSSATAPTAPVQTTRINVQAAGRSFEFTRTGLPAIGERFTWTFDGFDAYGRAVRGSVPVEIKVGYEFAGVSTRSTGTFGDVTGALLSVGNRAARTAVFSTVSRTTLLVQNTQYEEGMGGWMLSTHHHFDPGVGAALGDGRYLRGVNQFVLDTYAGGGTESVPPTAGMSADDLYIGSSTRSMHFAPNGDLLIFHTMSGSQGGRWALDAIHPNRTVTPIAGVPPLDSTNAALVNGSLALHAYLTSNTEFAVANDGTVYFVAPELDEVWKITNEATPHLVRVSRAGPANNSVCTAPFLCGDGGLVANADFRSPNNIVIAPDGSLIIGDSGHFRIRRVDPKGIVSTLEVRSDFTNYRSLSYGANGELFGVDNSTVVSDLSVPGRRIPRSGSESVGPNYGQAAAQWCGTTGGGTPSVFPVAPYYGGFLTACGSPAPQVRFVDETGLPTVVAGNLTEPTDYGDGGPAIRGKIGAVGAIAVRSPGEFFFVNRDATSCRIRRVSLVAPTPGAASSYAPDGDVVHEFDVGGRHTATKSALTGTALQTFAYDGATGYLTSITDRDGLVTTITRAGSTVTLTAPFGQQTKLGLDANSYLATVTMPKTTEVINVTHGPSGLLTGFRDPKSNQHTFVYDTYGRLTKDTDAVASSAGIRLTPTVVNGTHFQVTVTSPEGRAVLHDVALTSAPDDPTRLERRLISRPGNPTVTIDKAADGQWSTSRSGGSVFLSSSRVLSSANDPRWGALAPFVSSVEEKDGSRTLTRRESRTATLATPTDRYSLTTLSLSTSVEASGLPTRSWTNAFLKGAPSTWLSTSPEGRQTRTTLDSKERVTVTEILGSDPVTLASLQYHYDTSGRLDQITNGTRVYGTTYDASGWVSGTTAPESMSTTIPSRDANGRALSVVLPGSRTVGTTYDLAGNIASVTPPGKTAHAFTSNGTNRLGLYAPPTIPQTPKDTGYVYDKDGLLLSVSNPGLPVSFAYDGTNGRQISTTDAVNVLLGYDAAGRRNTFTTSDGVGTTVGFDGTLATSETTTGAWPVAHTLNRSFSHYGELASWGLDSATADVVMHDRDGLVTGNGPIGVVRSTNALVKTLAAGSTTETYSYNVNGERMGATATGVTGGYAVTYVRDTLGRITKKTETIGGTTVVTSYGYDTAGRLWKVYANGSPTPTSTHTYDANGNRAGGTYDGQDRLTALGATTYTYGPNGELKTKTDATGTTTYTYDAHGNLRRVVPPTPGATIDYVIDGQNRRVGKRLGGTFTNGWVYDGPRIVAELDASGAVLSRFYYGVIGHAPEAMVRGGVTYRILTDQLGSPRLVVNGTTGAVVQRLDYDAWGKVTADSSPGFQPFGFAGGLYDRTLGLVRFGARDYDPVSGRWTGKDLSRFAGGLNLYAYANNDPVNFIDVSGRFPLPAGPSGLGPGWMRDPTFDPLGNSTNQKFIHKSDDWVRFDKGNPNGPRGGHQTRDHIHHSSNPKKHFYPGDEVPDPPQMCQLDVRPQPEVDDMWDDAAEEPWQGFPLPFSPSGFWPAWAPVFGPLPAFAW